MKKGKREYNVTDDKRVCVFAFLSFPSSLQGLECMSAFSFFNEEEEKEESYSIPFGKELADMRLDLKIIKRQLKEKEIQLKYVKDYFNAVTQTRGVDAHTVQIMKKQKGFIEQDIENLKDMKTVIQNRISDFIKQKDEINNKRESKKSITMSQKEIEERDMILNKLAESVLLTIEEGKEIEEE